MVDPACCSQRLKQDRAACWNGSVRGLKTSDAMSRSSTWARTARGTRTRWRRWRTSKRPPRPPATGATSSAGARRRTARAPPSPTSPSSRQRSRSGATLRTHSRHGCLIAPTLQVPGTASIVVGAAPQTSLTNIRSAGCSIKTLIEEAHQLAVHKRAFYEAATGRIASSCCRRAGSCLAASSAAVVLRVLNTNPNENPHPGHLLVTGSTCWR